MANERTNLLARQNASLQIPDVKISDQGQLFRFGGGVDGAVSSTPAALRCSWRPITFQATNGDDASMERGTQYLQSATNVSGPYADFHNGEKLFNSIRSSTAILSTQKLGVFQRKGVTSQGVLPKSNFLNYFENKHRGRHVL